jgi:hypothetical protein
MNILYLNQGVRGNDILYCNQWFVQSYKTQLVSLWHGIGGAISGIVNVGVVILPCMCHCIWLRVNEGCDGSS